MEDLAILRDDLEIAWHSVIGKVSLERHTDTLGKLGLVAVVPAPSSM